MRRLLSLTVVATALCACGTATFGGPGGGSGGGAAGGSAGGTGGAGGGSAGGTGGGTGDAGTDGGTGPTWYKDVLPITQVSCIGCHTPGGIAYFALETYAEAQPVAMQMAFDVTSRRMPPWMPAAGCGQPFVGDRSLTPAQIDTIVAWSAAGAPEGNPADAPPAPDAGTGLPHVDQTLQMTLPYTPSATLTDDYHCFLVDPANATAKQVTGYDIQPGVRAEVHHVIVYVVDKAAAQAADDAEAGPGWTCFGGPGVRSDGALGAWAPGMPAVTYPANTGIVLQAGKALAIQIHYNTSAGTRTADQSSVKLMYASSAVTPAYLIPILDDTFAIPPDSINYTPPNYPVLTTNTYNIPIKIWGFLPHMHTLGRRITITGGPSNTCLVDIPKWDFHWQQQYFRPQPFVLANNQSIGLSCTWDNTTSNTIHWGEGTADEMCFAYLYATP